MVQVKENKMTGFLPYRSLARPHDTAVKNWARGNIEVHIPAHLATSVSGTPRLSIISGR